MLQTCDAVHQGLCSPAFSVIAFGLCSVHITYYSLVDHPFSLTLCVWGHYMYECVCTSVWICRAHKLVSGVSSIFTYFFESGSLTDWWGWLVTSSRTPHFCLSVQSDRHKSPPWAFHKHLGSWTQALLHVQWALDHLCGPCSYCL